MHLHQLACVNIGLSPHLGKSVKNRHLTISVSVSLHRCSRSAAHLPFLLFLCFPSVAWARFSVLRPVASGPGGELGGQDRAFCGGPRREGGAGDRRVHGAGDHREALREKPSFPRGTLRGSRTGAGSPTQRGAALPRSVARAAGTGKRKRNPPAALRRT